MEINPVLKTLLYEDIFNFPLYKKEIWSFLISDRKISSKKFELFLKDPRIYFDEKTKLYGLKKNEKFYKSRIDKKNKSSKNEEIVNRAIYFLSKIPTIQMIGISGSMAQFSGNEDDDIDLFLLVEKNTVWISRFFSVIFLKLNGIYRSDKNYKNKICLNMITDQYLLSLDRHDLYSAFEIAQLRPRLSRNHSYEKFISSNNWINKLLPNFDSSFNLIKISADPSPKYLQFIFEILLILRFEKLTQFIQLIYMKKRTKETVGNHILAFHPRDSRGEIMKKYNLSIFSTRGY
jgi:hypothetical protein